MSKGFRSRSIPEGGNRLKTLAKPGSGVTYAYNGLGDRLRETVNGVTTTFTMDLNAGLTQALSDGTNTYIYGVGRIAQATGTGTEYFLGDALGSVRQLTNASGSITFARTYDPYGVSTQASGSSQSAYGYTGEFTSNNLVYLRARMYAPGTGRFLTRDTWAGNANMPISFNRWNYTNSNPTYYTDASGNFPIPLILLLLALGIITFGTSGCNAGPEPDVCPPLPDNLQPDALKDNPRDQSLANIKDYFGIQLPPPVTYVDRIGNSHSTSYDFVYSSLVPPDAGFTPWFGDDLPLRKWGQVVIFETTFQQVGDNVYDIADAMVHEAYHAWQQYTLAQLAQDPESRFAQAVENQTYYTKEWQLDHNALLEYEASSYVLRNSPSPICTSAFMQNNERGNQEKYSDYMSDKVIGIDQSPWLMAGTPLP